MRSRPARRGYALARGVALLGLACALPAHADWKRDYDRGLRAFEKQNWAEAEAAFRAALAEEPTPDARKRFQGVRTAVYVPHYYAGVAAWRQGACERALQLWSNAASTAVVAGVSALDAEQERGTLDCRARIAAAAKPAAGATASVASPASPAVEPAAPPAAPPAAQAPQRVDAVSAVARPTPTPTPPPTVPPRASPPVDSAATAATAPPRSSPAATPSAAPAALGDAVEHYAAGRYDALLQLDPARLADGRSRAQVYLLRAAARHRRAELDGDDAALDAARRDVRAARAANASLTPDATWFPPRFVAFWRATR